MSTSIAAVLDSSIILALALLACAALARRGAALRHAVLTAALLVAAAAPALEMTLPHWEIPILSSGAEVTSSGATLSSSAPTGTVAATVELRAASGISWPTVALGLWGLGFVVVISGLLAGMARLAWLTRRCRPIASGAWQEQATALSSQYGLTPPVVLRSVDRALLLTWGHFRPRIIVPAGAASWTTERIQVVLAHELAHIRRRDWALQIGAETLRAVYWFNPLVWIVCRRLRDESEQACDDTVLRRGVEATDYASHLLAVARHVVAEGRGWATAPAIASPSTLERRIASMLNVSRNREPLRRGSGAFTLLAMLVVAVPVAALTVTERTEAAPTAPGAVRDIALHAPSVAPTPNLDMAAPQPSRRAAPRAAAAADTPQQTPTALSAPFRPRVPAASPEAPTDAQQSAPASLSGTMSDASGAVLPGVMIMVSDPTGTTRRTAVSDGAGRFTIRDLAPGQYELVASLPGFATILNELKLAAGDNAQVILSMRIGMLEETIRVGCAAGGAALPGAGRIFALERRPPATRLFTVPSAEAQDRPVTLGKPVRVGGQIKAPRKLRDVNPVCPRLLLPSLAVVVNLEATIGADGSVKDVRFLSPVGSEQPPPEFVESATEAVQQWQFSPTLLNNVPVPVIMSVRVEYRRM